MCVTRACQREMDLFLMVHTHTEKMWPPTNICIFNHNLPRKISQGKVYVERKKSTIAGGPIPDFVVVESKKMK